MGTKSEDFGGTTGPYELVASGGGIITKGSTLLKCITRIPNHQLTIIADMVKKTLGEFCYLSSFLENAFVNKNMCINHVVGKCLWFVLNWIQASASSRPLLKVARRTTLY